MPPTRLIWKGWRNLADHVSGADRHIDLAQPPALGDFHKALGRRQRPLLAQHQPAGCALLAEQLEKIVVVASQRAIIADVQGRRVIGEDEIQNDTLSTVVQCLGD